MKSEPEYISPREFATAMHLHLNTVYRLIELGDVPAVKLGSQFRIPREFKDELTLKLPLITTGLQRNPQRKTALPEKANGGPRMSSNILRLPAVKARCGLSRSSIYTKMADGTFPRAIRLGEHSVGWHESEIDEWVSQRSRTPFTPLERVT